MLNITPIPKIQCPYCGKPMNRVGSPEAEAKPIPGAYVMCCECTGLSVFNDNLSLRKVTADEMRILQLDEDVMRELSRFALIAEFKKKMEAAAKN